MALAECAYIEAQIGGAMSKVDVRAEGFIALLNEGFSMTEVGKLSGLSRERVRQITRAAGWTGNVHTAKLLMSATAIMRALRHQDSRTLSGVAMRAGITRGRTEIFLKQFGVWEIALRLFRARTYRAQHNNKRRR